MPQTLYGFRHAISAFYEMPTEAARKLLPGHLQPFERQHGCSILALTAFDFTKSMVGAYQEIVLAVIVPPLAKPGGEFPRSAFYPWIVGTSTEESREHAIERWSLPHHMADIAVDFEDEDGLMTAKVREGDRPVLDFAVREHDWSDVDHLYQCFMVRGDAGLKVDIHMQGRFSEHEEEQGSLALHDHPMCEGLDPDEVDDRPFRELWMQSGRQVFEELETLAPA